MKHTPVDLDLSIIPATFHPLLKDCPVYDSSCSNTAKVYYIHRGIGYYLKSAPKGTLKSEADMTAFFHRLGLSTEVLCYESAAQDWMLTSQIKGTDCLSREYTDDPVRLCDTTAKLLRMLHDTNTTNCPVPNRTKDYLSNAIKNFNSGTYDPSLFPDNWGYASAEDAIRVIESEGKYLKADTLLHGDYCLPNIILDNWSFAGFIDLASGGIGDRHIDLFWGIWSLGFNLKTDRYRERFLDVYGRSKINEDVFRIISAIEVF